MKGLKLGVIGCGNMGGAIVRGVVERGTLAGENILVNDKDVDRATLLSDETGCRLEELSGLAEKSDIILIAVKPQDFESLAAKLSGKVSGKAVVSVMAGVSINRITQVLGGDIQVVRAMPNMAAFIAEAVTCIAMNGPVDKKPDIVDILMGIGLVIEVKEDQMDAVTAVSGSGPAYLFFLADAMMSAASGLGLGQKEADMLVRQTLYGSAALLKGSEEGPDELISKVASKGGTTEAALSVFKKKGLAGAIEEAVRAAKKRSGELSGGLS